ncbi:MAG TPA: hypothetical protein VJ843_01905 [Candidatus Saccharimonadales bacterium]|nr:hypothetical protein [Candidatus Saccharimonadales bacterium]
MTADNVSSTAKSRWLPQHSLLDVAVNLGVRPKTNWGRPVLGDGSRPLSLSSTSLRGELTGQDVQLISGLRLDPALHGSLVCAIFKDLVQALPAAQRPNGAIQEEWVDILLYLVPHCSHGRAFFGSAKAAAADYITRGVAPLLLPLYLLLLRSDTWINQIHRQIDGPLQSPRPLSEELANGYDPHVLIGDPCSFEHVETGHWDVDLMAAREHFFSYGVIDGEWNRAIQDLLFSLDILVRVAAACSPLGSRIRGYDFWARQT